MSTTRWQNELNIHSSKAETLIPSHIDSLSIPVSSMSVHNALHRIDLNTVVQTYLSVTRSACYRSCSDWKHLICLINQPLSFRRPSLHSACQCAPNHRASTYTIYKLMMLNNSLCVAHNTREVYDYD